MFIKLQSVKIIIFTLIANHCFSQVQLSKIVTSEGTTSDIMPAIISLGVNSNNIKQLSKYTQFNVVTALGNADRNGDVMEDSIHDKIKKNAIFAKNQNISVVADLDLRMALTTFGKRYPDDLQESVVLKEFPLSNKTTKIKIEGRKIRDHYHRPSYETVKGEFKKVYIYNLTQNGQIDPETLIDISQLVTVSVESPDYVEVEIPKNISKSATHIFCMVSFMYLYPDIFSPHIQNFQKDIIHKYADVPLGGILYDEWGFPATLDDEAIMNEYWYSSSRDTVYSKITNGRSLIDDFILMNKGIKGKESERYLAINYFREMALKRIVALEENFYNTVKETFGEKSIVAVHPTWFPYPEKREFKKNGLHWWAVKRDWAQTDEVVPYGVRTAIAKKWKSPVWYSMYYKYGTPRGSVGTKSYEDELWSYALAGGRMNLLPSIVNLEGIIGSDFIRGQSRIRLLNYINPKPLDCKVAVVFGHASAMNRAGEGFNSVGMNLVDSLWNKGIPADLIPSSEIWEKNLKIDKDGFVTYGSQRYSAVILFNPEFEKQETLQFFSKVRKGATRLYQNGAWKNDFKGDPINGDALLSSIGFQNQNPQNLISSISRLIKPSITPATRKMVGFGHVSYVTPTTGYAYLMDGTLLEVAGTHNASGDTIQSKKNVNGFDVRFDAVGVAAVRLDTLGNILALAAGGLRDFKTDKMSLHLKEPIDLAFWLNEKGNYEGVIQGWDKEIPKNLLNLTSHWKRIELPEVHPKIIYKPYESAFLRLGSKSKKTLETVMDNEGNIYPVIAVGNQKWMGGNLKNGHIKWIQNGNETQDFNVTDRSYWVDNDSIKNSAYGKLYSYHVVENGCGCPDGWRYPKEEDWKLLLQNIKQYKKPENEMSFTPQASGYRHPYGSYFDKEEYGFWWMAGNREKRVVWNRSKSTLQIVDDRILPRDYGLSIRCIKNKE